eukprot:Clim_evm12s206 gene=Clim_evmTU12s206
MAKQTCVRKHAHFRAVIPGWELPNALQVDISTDKEAARMLTHYLSSTNTEDDMAHLFLACQSLQLKRQVLRALQKKGDAGTIENFLDTIILYLQTETSSMDQFHVTQRAITDEGSQWFPAYENVALTLQALVTDKALEPEMIGPSQTSHQRAVSIIQTVDLYLMHVYRTIRSLEKPGRPLFRLRECAMSAQRAGVRIIQRILEEGRLPEVCERVNLSSSIRSAHSDQEVYDLSWARGAQLFPGRDLMLAMSEWMHLVSFVQCVCRVTPLSPSHIAFAICQLKSCFVPYDIGKQFSDIAKDLRPRLALGAGRAFLTVVTVQSDTVSEQDQLESMNILAGITEVLIGELADGIFEEESFGYAYLLAVSIRDWIETVVDSASRLPQTSIKHPLAETDLRTSGEVKGLLFRRLTMCMARYEAAGNGAVLDRLMEGFNLLLSSTTAHWSSSKFWDDLLRDLILGRSWLARRKYILINSLLKRMMIDRSTKVDWPTCMAFLDNDIGRSLMAHLRATRNLTDTSHFAVETVRTLTEGIMAGDDPEENEELWMSHIGNELLQFMMFSIAVDSNANTPDLERTWKCWIVPAIAVAPQVLTVLLLRLSQLTDTQCDGLLRTKYFLLSEALAIRGMSTLNEAWARLPANARCETYAVHYEQLNLGASVTMPFLVEALGHWIGRRSAKPQLAFTSDEHFSNFDELEVMRRLLTHNMRCQHASTRQVILHALKRTWRRCVNMSAPLTPGKLDQAHEFLAFSCDVIETGRLAGASIYRLRFCVHLADALSEILVEHPEMSVLRPCMKTLLRFGITLINHEQRGEVLVPAVNVVMRLLPSLGGPQDLVGVEPIRRPDVEQVFAIKAAVTDVVAVRLIAHWRATSLCTEVEDPAVDDWAFLWPILERNCRAWTISHSKPDSGTTLLRACQDGWCVHGLLFAIEQYLVQSGRLLGSTVSFRWVNFLVNIAYDFVHILTGSDVRLQTTNSSFRQMNEHLNELATSAEDHGGTMDDSFDVNDTAAVLQYVGWMTVARSLSLLSMIVRRGASEVTDEGNVLALFVNILCRCRHKGVIEAARTGFRPIAQALSLRSVTETLTSFCDRDMATIDANDTLRRSAGVPWIFLSLLKPVCRQIAIEVRTGTCLGHEAQCESQQVVRRVLSILIARARGEVCKANSAADDYAAVVKSLQVHSMNSLTALMKDPELLEITRLYLDRTGVAAFEGLADSNWLVRNASLRLYGSVRRRMLQCGDGDLSHVSPSDLQRLYPSTFSLFVKAAEECCHWHSTGKTLSNAPFAVNGKLRLTMDFLSQCGPSFDRTFSVSMSLSKAAQWCARCGPDPSLKRAAAMALQRLPINPEEVSLPQWPNLQMERDFHDAVLALDFFQSSMPDRLEEVRTTRVDLCESGAEKQDIGSLEHEADMLFVLRWMYTHTDGVDSARVRAACVSAVEKGLRLVVDLSSGTLEKNNTTAPELWLVFKRELVTTANQLFRTRGGTVGMQITWHPSLAFFPEHTDHEISKPAVVLHTALLRSIEDRLTPQDLSEFAMSWVDDLSILNGPSINGSVERMRAVTVCALDDAFQRHGLWSILKEKVGEAMAKLGDIEKHGKAITRSFVALSSAVLDIWWQVDDCRVLDPIVGLACSWDNAEDRLVAARAVSHWYKLVIKHNHFKQDSTGKGVFTNGFVGFVIAMVLYLLEDEDEMVRSMVADNCPDPLGSGSNRMASRHFPQGGFGCYVMTTMSVSHGTTPEVYDAIRSAQEHIQDRVRKETRSMDTEDPLFVRQEVNVYTETPEIRYAMLRLGEIDELKKAMSHAVLSCCF